MATGDVKIIDGDGHIVEDIPAIMDVMPPAYKEDISLKTSPLLWMSCLPLIRRKTEDAIRSPLSTTCIPLIFTITLPVPFLR
jgi:hypothetical protein